MIGVIARKEFTELCRDNRYRMSVVIILVLLIAGSLLGWRNYADLSGQAEEAAEHDYRRWGQQDPKHPHDAAHYGIYAFKTPRPLAIVDGGIESYIGASTLNGAHQQGEVEFPPAQDTTALQRFGDISPSAVAQVLLPLLVILLSFAAFAGEREQGTLRQLWCLGIKPKAFLGGKAAAIIFALATILAPMAIAGIVVAGYLAPPESRVDELIRATLLVLVYGLYLLIFLLLSLGVSACCRSARTALAILLVFWGITVFAVPRAVLDMSGRFYQTPANVEFWQKLTDDLYKTGQASEESLQKKLLAQYKVNKIEELPFDYTGLSMQAGEEAAWAVYERYEKQRYGIYAQQNRLLEWGTLISPSAGIALLSMALSGNDLPQHHDFTRQVEQHRRTMNKLLNDYVAQHAQKGATGGDGLTLKADRALWQSVPAFAYQPPIWPAAVYPYALALVLLLAWCLAALIFARLAVSRLSVV